MEEVMNRKQQMGVNQLIRRRKQGQSIPLIALMILVLVAMVGLSVDVGNTFAEERKAVAASNAASLSAMDAYIRRTAATTTDSIYQRINETFRENGIDLTANPQLRLEAIYLDAQGQPISNALPTISAGDSSPVPENVAYIQVRLNGTVDTYFARVVGREDLPINATSYAGTCPPNSGVYPIAVNTEYIDGNRFINPGDPQPGEDREFWTIDSGPYRGFTKRRLYVHDTAPGGFSWLRWMDGQGAMGASATSQQELNASLAGEGNIAAGFMEAPWPNVSSPPRPEVYPEMPGQLNTGDWVWGTSGWKAGNGRQDAMKGHIQNGTRMILPIYDTYVGQSSNTQYRVVRLGLFVITAEGSTPGRGPWLEMIFLGDAQRQGTACVATPPTPDDSKIELFGPVALWPEYQIRPKNHKPVQYVIVLDVSGSMNANFIGQGIRNGQVTQCTNGPAGAPPNQNCGNPENAWNVVQERRIYVAKKAMETLVRLANLRNNPNYDPTKPFDQIALVWYNHNLSGWRGFSNDANQVINTITNAGMAQNDPYKTSGGTNGAVGLFQASEILKNAPRKTTELGREWEYKRVVIFVTDGVSNAFFREPRLTNDGISNADTYPSNPMHFCRTLGQAVVENAQCQTTEFGGKSNGRDRPITQMENVSKEKLKPIADVYAVALSDIPATGLRTGVASVPAYYYEARNLERNANGKTNVDLIFEAINQNVQNDVCLPGVDNQWRSTIPPEHFQSVGNLTYPNVGEVILTDINTGTRYVAPIRAETNGRLVYRFNDLPRGSYRLTPYLFYRHPLDPPGTLPRRYSLIESAGTTVADTVVNLAPSDQRPGFSTVIEQPLNLRLFGDVCARP
jgi:hypothetical protein